MKINYSIKNLKEQYSYHPDTDILVMPGRIYTHFTGSIYRIHKIVEDSYVVVEDREGRFITYQESPNSEKWNDKKTWRKATEDEIKYFKEHAKSKI